jgi:hypothetical protein
VLYRLREEIADTEDRRKWVAVGLSRQIDFMSKAMPAYCFGGGFPMSKEDQEIFGDPQVLSGNLKITATSEAPEALIFPAKAPESLRMRTPFSLALTLIFNRTQPTDRRYAIVLTVNGTGAAFNHILEQKKLEIKEGRAQVTVNEDFLTLPPRFTPAVDSEGNVRLYASVAWKRSREGVGDEWVPISFACSITLSGP